MSASEKSLSSYDPEKVPDASTFRIGIVVAEYNHRITSALLRGCKETLLKHGTSENNIEIIHVPGSFELPSGAQKLLEEKLPDAVICLGCIIKGETKHDEYISYAVAQGIMQCSIDYQRPVIFGVLTTQNALQAEARAGGKHGNKGIEAAIAAIKMAALRKGSGSTLGFRK